ncbi:MAG TPA: hypothetical protein VIT45_17900 [Allosphingosinicella sp.]
MPTPSSERTTRLTKSEVHALTASACAGLDFEPFVGRIVEPEILDQVVEAGLVEKGPSCRPAVGRTGYRLTDRGWTRFNRVGAHR